MMKTIAFLILTGSVLFLVASFSPISRVHMEPTAAGRLAIITAEPTAWLIAQLLYSFGAFITAAGIAAAAFQLRNRVPSALSYSVILFITAGVIYFGAYVYFRSSNPQAWVQTTPPYPSFLTYSFLTQAALLLFGVMLLIAGLPRWLGWLVTASMLLLILLTVVFRDMPPFAYYLLGLPIGIVFLRRSRSTVLTAQEHMEQETDLQKLKSRLEKS